VECFKTSRGAPRFAMLRYNHDHEFFGYRQSI
jgi:hypothetical protein